MRCSYAGSKIQQSIWKCDIAVSTVINDIIIRAAKADDFEWVASLMARALSPFYDGDHRAHARRIFNTRMKGGVDRVGQFSTGQHMFIAEQDGCPVGLVHVVEKKQRTVKISPLIVDTDYRGKLGIGSMLLNHAENFARYNGARQLYCTVASPNQKALGFFIQKGFRITGTAKDHSSRCRLRLLHWRRNLLQ